MGLDDTQRQRLGHLAERVEVHRELSKDGQQPLRDAVYAAHQNGATVREIAQATGRAASTVQSWIVAEAARRQALAPHSDTDLP